MSNVVDARGLSCPQPVILTRKAMAESADLVTIVSSATSRDNVRRMAERAGRTVTVEEIGDDFHLSIKSSGLTSTPPDSAVAASPKTLEAAPAGPLVLFVTDKKMGRGDEVLGDILVRGFFHTLVELDRRPEIAIFVNAGVWLAIDDSPVLEDLLALEKLGVTLLACGTCLDYYGIKDRLAVGQVSNMYEIAETMLSAIKVVSL